MVSPYQAKIIKHYTGFPQSKLPPLSYNDVFELIGKLYKKNDTGMDDLLTLMKPFILKPEFALTEAEIDNLGPTFRSKYLSAVEHRKHDRDTTTDTPKESNLDPDTKIDSDDDAITIIDEDDSNVVDPRSYYEGRRDNRKSPDEIKKDKEKREQSSGRDTKQFKVTDEEIKQMKTFDMIKLMRRRGFDIPEDALYFMINAPWKNWDHSSKNRTSEGKIIWGASADNLGRNSVYEKLKPGMNVIFFSSNTNDPGPFEKKVIFGFGIATKKYTNNDPFWPDEIKSKTTRWPLKFEIEPFHEVYNTRNAINWIKGLPFTKGFNAITDPQRIEQLLKAVERKWKNISDFWAYYREYIREYWTYQEEDAKMKPVYKTDEKKLVVKGIIIHPKMLIRPILEILKDGECHHKAEVDDILAEKLFKVTTEELRAEMYESTGNSVFYQKVVLDISTLRYNELIEDCDNNGRSPWRLSDKGKEFLKQPENILFANCISLKSNDGLSADDGKSLSEIIEDTQVEEKMNEEPESIDTDVNLERSEKFLETVEEIQTDLELHESVMYHIVDALIGGNHILLAGPIGTGKTHLAKLLPKLFSNEKITYDYKMYTATSEWSTQEVIGGIVPKMKNDDVIFSINDGCIVETLKANEENKHYWTIIDEFNRANIDKAFGPLFTSLRDKTLRQIPTNDEHKTYEEMKIPSDYRIIGTMNTHDKSFLFNLSDALKSRFSIIKIPVPEDIEDEIYTVTKKIIENESFKTNIIEQSLFFDSKSKLLSPKIESPPEIKKLQVYSSIRLVALLMKVVRKFHLIGPALLEKMITMILSEKDFINDPALNTSELRTDSVGTSTTFIIAPQLSNLTKSEIGAIRSVFQKDGVMNYFKDAHESRQKQNFSKEFGKILELIEIKNSKELSKQFLDNDNLGGQWDLVNQKHVDFVTEFTGFAIDGIEELMELFISELDDMESDSLV